MIPINQMTKKFTRPHLRKSNDMIKNATSNSNQILKERRPPNLAVCLKSSYSQASTSCRISIGAGGDDQSMQESMSSMIQAIVLGILFIFLILAAQFESWIDPLAIMFPCP